MAEINESKLRDLITEIVTDTIEKIIASSMIMPETPETPETDECCQQVTEVIIRCGSPDAVRILGSGSNVYDDDETPCVPPCPKRTTPSFATSYDELSVESKSLFAEVQNDMQISKESLMKIIHENTRNRLVNEVMKDLWVDFRQK